MHFRCYALLVVGMFSEILTLYFLSVKQYMQEKLKYTSTKLAVW